MTSVNNIFERLHELTHEEGQNDLASLIMNSIFEHDDRIEKSNIDYQVLNSFLLKIFHELDELSTILTDDDTILISVRNQKTLRTCFQLVTSLGVSQCLIPGLGISLSKRCISAAIIPSILLTDEQKYEILVACTDLFTRCYKVPVLKSIILTFHMSDYLAALIQLSFAPLKKPGVYTNFTMTQELYDKLLIDKQKYVQIYENLVNNCFQPILMKELLILQCVNNPPPPMFVKRVISKEMSRRLLAPGGLLSLIRCFIESYNIDTGFEWKKIDMICKIVSTKHGNDTEESYLQNICSQLMQIFNQQNTHYLATAVACILNLNEKYSQSEPVKKLVQDIFQAFNYKHLLSKSNNLPGTVILTPQEVERKVNALNACVNTTKLEYPITLIYPNVDILFYLGVKCTKNEDMKLKIKDILLKCLAQLDKSEITIKIQKFLFGNPALDKLSVEEFEAGLTIKFVSHKPEHCISDAIVYFINLFKLSTANTFATNVFEASLAILIDLSSKRKNKSDHKKILSDDNNIPFTEIDEQYANTLQLLSEISTSPKIIAALKERPTIVLEFIEYFITKTENNSDEECVTIALVLLNTILSNSDQARDLEQRLGTLIPVLKKMANNSSDFTSLLCKEALSFVTSTKPKQADTAYERAVSKVFDDLLPVRAHGTMELTKLIDAKDPETISKKHYIFCLLQEQLKDRDSYIYLSAINGIASLGTHCTEDVLQILCQEFLTSSEQNDIQTNDDLNKIAEQRMKIADIIVKVTKRLGEMAIVHKTILLNTMLCGCRDDDPLIRTSALSNLAEIALVLHYRIGSIIYEILLCIWGIIETDKAVECRRSAVMVISYLLKGLGKETLLQLKENLLPIYRTLKNLYRDPVEDSVVKLHAQIALEELDEIVKQLMFPEVKMNKQIFVLDNSEEIIK